MERLLEKINGFVWGIPALALILGVGIYLTVRTGCVQLRLLPKAVSAFLSKFGRRKTDAGESSFQALCTAMAATVGTGNIAGVAGAIALGGPGSIFWMWVSAILGMITKFAEATLSVCYRRRGRDGDIYGGPMYMIETGMGKKWRPLAVSYCFFGVVAAFGMGNGTQVNAVVDSVHFVIGCFEREATLYEDLLIGVCLAALAAVSLAGGAKRIGQIATMLVPVAAAAYITLSLGALAAHARAIPGALHAIVAGAFSPQAITGGALGSVFISLRVGLARGVFTNEAGMGTAGIAHGQSEVEHPAEQGLMGIMEVFLDTIVICTLTALVILTSGTEIPYGLDEGALLTTRAFAMTYGQWVSIPLALFLCCFAFATMLGWGLYGLRCAQYLFGKRCWRFFILLQAIAAVGSTVLKTGTVWMLSETVNGLMAIPNLVCLASLSPVLTDIIRDYEKKKSAGRSSLDRYSDKRDGRGTVWTMSPDS